MKFIDYRPHQSMLETFLSFKFMYETNKKFKPLIWYINEISENLTK
jgi:hypothetical protein